MLKVRHVSKTFRIRKADTFLESMMGGGTTRTVHAVNDVSFDVERGECLGLVGESGCGKTTLSKMLMRGISADAAPDGKGKVGRVVFDDWGRKTDVLKLEGEELNRFRTKLQFIFQDPFGSLNPRMTVYDILVEPLIIHGIGDDAYRREMVSELMEMVGLDRRHLSRYPHSFSGGQRQRIGIARALALRPDMVICDEPVSALDVSIQAQILNLLKDLQKQLGLTYLFISHNLAVVDYIADRIAVMCAGRLVELAPAGELFRNPMHPYTKALLTAVPMPDPDARLDLGALMEGKASDPTVWPAPFRDDGKAPLFWTEAEPRPLCPHGARRSLSMLRFIVRRVLLMIPTLFVISALVYFIIDLPPGDCVSSQIEELVARGDADAHQRAEELRELYGLNLPLWQRYLEWVGGIFRWDFGLSCQDTVPVADLIGERLTLTIIMETSTIAFIWIVSFLIGTYAATHQYKLGDYVASFIGFIGLAIPNFLLALVLLYVGKVYFGLSIGGLMDPEYIDKPLSWGKALSVMQHLIIPVIVIGMSGTAGMIRRLRANLLDELQKQYVVTGRAKGLPPMKLLVKYPLRHSLNLVRRRYRWPVARRHLGLGHRLGRAVAAHDRADAAGRAQDPGRQPRPPPSCCSWRP